MFHPGRREIHHSDPYPWLAPDDPRRFQKDSQILYEKIDWSQSHPDVQRKSQTNEVSGESTEMHLA